MSQISYTQEIENFFSGDGIEDADQFPQKLSEWIFSLGARRRADILKILYSLYEKAVPYGNIEGLGYILELAKTKQQLPHKFKAQLYYVAIQHNLKDFAELWPIESLKAIHSRKDAESLPDDKREQLKKFTLMAINHNIGVMNRDFRELEHSTKSEAERLCECNRIEPFFREAKREEERRNHTWTVNQGKISQVIHDHVTGGLIPSVTDIAGKAGLSTYTVYKHLKSFRNSEYLQDKISVFRALIPNVLTMLYDQAINEKSIQAASLFSRMVGADGSGDNAKNQYIQINNLSIQKEELNKLPSHKKAAIEEFILRTMNEPSAIEIDSQGKILNGHVLNGHN